MPSRRAPHPPCGFHTARADSATIGSRALALAKVLKPHGKLLASAGYPKAFLAQFTKDAQLLASASKAAVKARERRSKATAAVRREIGAAMATVTVIEGLVMAHTSPDSWRGTVKLWRQTRRVPARIGRPRARGQAARRPAPGGDQATT